MLRDPHAFVHSLPTYAFSAHTLLLTLSDSVPVNVGTDLEIDDLEMNDLEIDSELTNSHTRGGAQSRKQIALTRVEAKDRRIKEDMGSS